MEDLGVNSFRFSISWARILPKGRFGNLNMIGIKHYDRLIDTLLRRGIQPFVALTHYDIPQELEDRYGGWLSAEVQADFKYYADACFKYFGHRVKYWITFNEPNVVAIRAYRSGIYPPSRCSPPFGNCSSGNSEEYLVAAHNMILSHAKAVSVYRRKYQEEQHGSIGIVMNAVWFEPISGSSEDNLAADRAQFLDPIIFGRYPDDMQQYLGSSLPVFTNTDKRNLRYGLDFIGINHYTSFYVKDCIYSICEEQPEVSRAEGYVSKSALKDGVPIGELTAVDWLHVFPQGMEKMVTYIKNRFNNIPIFITENGLGEMNQGDAFIAELLNDTKRVEYMSNYLESLAKAIK
ncbi:hypothetical protein Leryth_026475 [Lithospermum erythrorhizon]|nr:hypothetical protein Leryth_026475 [Lithospermum erythrorhizon]